MQPGSAAPGEGGWVVLYTPVSVCKGAWFPPPCFKIVFAFGEGEWLKRVASSDRSMDQSFLKDRSFLFILTRFCFVGNLLLLAISLCGLTHTLQLCMVIFHCCALKAFKIAQPMGLANTNTNVFLSWLTAACVHLLNSIFISLYDIFLVLESVLHGRYL